MNKIIPLALLLSGIVLIFIGFNGTNSFNSDVSRFFSGSPTNEAVWMQIAGLVAAAAGLATLWRTLKHT